MLKILLIVLLLAIAIFFITRPESNKNLIEPQALQETFKSVISELPKPTPSPTPIPISTAPTKILNNDYHVFQTFNNCGPAALSMALSYYGIQKSQEELGQNLRPYQIPGGDNDDKSVTLEEVAEKAKEFGLIPYLRPNGNIEIIKKFIASDIPVITRTWLKENDDIGHYRIIKGYDDSKGQLIQDDSLQGKNLRYSYSSFDKIWDKFNYEFLVLVPIEKQQLAEQILGEDLNRTTSWLRAINLSQEKLAQNPSDKVARFNLSVAYYNLGDYEAAVKEFEAVENQLSFRVLWYQIEPIKAYYELGKYDRVIEISDKILNYHNRAFSELYLLKGNIYLKQGDKTAAKSEFEKAVFYNKNLKSAKEALSSVD